MTLIYCSAARQEEQKFLNSPLALEYRRYRETTRSFFPRIAKRRTAVSFDVRLIRSAAELACV